MLQTQKENPWTGAVLSMLYSVLREHRKKMNHGELKRKIDVISPCADIYQRGWMNCQDE